MRAREEEKTIILIMWTVFMSSTPLRASFSYLIHLSLSLFFHRSLTFFVSFCLVLISFFLRLYLFPPLPSLSLVLVV